MNQHTPPPAPIQAWDTRPTSFLAVASLTFSLLWIFGIGSLLAVVSGHSSRRETHRGRNKGDGLAHAGLILGYIGLIPAVLFIVVLMAGGGPFGTETTSYQPTSYGERPLSGCEYSNGMGSTIVCY